MMKRLLFLMLVLEGVIGLHRSTSASLHQWLGAQTWITVMLNGLPWIKTKIILSFLRLHPSSAFVDYDGYSISSKGFLMTVVYIMVI